MRAALAAVLLFSFVAAAFWMAGAIDRRDRRREETMTEAQRALQAKHGTPAEFAKAVTKAIGEISVDEALTAIARYEREWHEAGRRDAT